MQHNKTGSLRERTKHIRRRTVFADGKPADGRSKLLKTGVGLTVKFVADGLHYDSVREQGCQQTHENYSISSWKITRPQKKRNVIQ
jgi:hypothetical protein